MATSCWLMGADPRNAASGMAVVERSRTYHAVDDTDLEYSRRAWKEEEKDCLVIVIIIIEDPESRKKEREGARDSRLP